MRRFLTALAIVGLLLGMPTPVASAQAAPFCRPGQAPQFVLGFASLRVQLGATMGDPIECEHPNSANGDTLQKTTTGLAFYRKATNTPTFTDGFRHWGLTSSGLVYWEGSSVDPPAAAAPPPPAPSPPPPNAPAAPLRRFVDGIVGQVNSYWREFFAGTRYTYFDPTVYWIGRGESATCMDRRLGGHAYCVPTWSMYLFESFDSDASFDDLWSRGQEFSIVVIIAHEFGHHVQAAGITGAGLSPLERELQADCMAGMFTWYARRRGWLSPGELDQGVLLSLHAGDTAHGEGADRVFAFLSGVNGSLCGILL